MGGYEGPPHPHPSERVGCPVVRKRRRLRSHRGGPDRTRNGRGLCSCSAEDEANPHGSAATVYRAHFARRERDADRQRNASSAAKATQPPGRTIARWLMVRKDHYGIGLAACLQEELTWFGTASDSVRPLGTGAASKPAPSTTVPSRWRLREQPGGQSATSAPSTGAGNGAGQQLSCAPPDRFDGLSRRPPPLSAWWKRCERRRLIPSRGRVRPLRVSPDWNIHAILRWNIRDIYPRVTKCSADLRASQGGRGCDRC